MKMSRVFAVKYNWAMLLFSYYYVQVPFAEARVLIAYQAVIRWSTASTSGVQDAITSCSAPEVQRTTKLVWKASTTITRYKRAITRQPPASRTPATQNLALRQVFISSFIISSKVIAIIRRMRCNSSHNHIHSL